MKSEGRGSILAVIPQQKEGKGNMSCSTTCKTHSLRKHRGRDDESNVIVVY